MDDLSVKTEADRRFDEALAATGARDPRDFYRARLRELRERDERAFRKALDYYETKLVPAVAREGSQPLQEWLDYGRLLASLLTPGKALQIDPSGRSHPYERPIPSDRLVLHLPDAQRERALAIGIPAELSPAQRATYELLVRTAGDDAE